MMDEKNRRKGQALIEFALILPLLLLIIVGLFEFGRIVFVYANLFNATREGVRYGLTSPQDYNGILQHAQDTITLVQLDPGSDLFVKMDTGPGSGDICIMDVGDTCPDYAVIGNRVLVEITYALQPMTPLFEPIVSEFNLQTEAARTIQRVGATISTPPPTAPPGGGATSTPTSTPTPTATSTPTETPIPTASATPTLEATATPSGSPTPSPTSTGPTSTPTPDLIQIHEPVFEETSVISGTAEPNATVTLQVAQDPSVELSAQVDANGNFAFDVSGIVLVAGYTVSVSGYGQVDLALVQARTTPEPTPPPDTPYITINPACGPTSSSVITVTGHNWPAGTYVRLLFDADVVVDFFGKMDSGGSYPNGYFEETLTVNNISAATHEVTAEAYDKTNKGTLQASYSVDFLSPCEEPDLIIQDLVIQNSPPIGTFRPITVSLTIANQGAADISSSFWVDLFADVLEPASDASVDYMVVNSMPGNTAYAFEMTYTEGFPTTGPHTLLAMVDSKEQIGEDKEDNNVSETKVLTVTQENPTPTPTATLDPNLAKGSIAGFTFRDGSLVGRVNVEVYNADGQLVWAGLSLDSPPEQTGFYQTDAIPVGENYRVEGWLVVQTEDGPITYQGSASPVSVLTDTVTFPTNINLTAPY